MVIRSIVALVVAFALGSAVACGGRSRPAEPPLAPRDAELPPRDPTNDVVVGPFVASPQDGGVVYYYIVRN